jgi:hypothetical protein
VYLAELAVCTLDSFVLMVSSADLIVSLAFMVRFSI